MHPYQEQVNLMLSFIKRRNRAKSRGFWLESIDLSYVLLEIGLRLLLSSKASPSRVPIQVEEIDERKYLMTLAKLAKDKGFIDQPLYERIKVFNNFRVKAIHQLAQEGINYSDLEEAVDMFGNLYYDIQSCWLPITFGKEEILPENNPQ